ncbi:MAG: hypothetical protein FWC70_12650 [Defluviitaleaceae bacterium]|nr:hypothetical protein [Defluviitaleaceae bacterium]
MNIRESVTELYRLYGFTVDTQLDDAIAFILEGNYFNNVEIVHFSDDDTNAGVLKCQYEEIDYSAQIVAFESVEGTHKRLYNRRFQVKAANAKLLDEHARFCAQQSRGYDYEYINCEYLMDNERKHDNLADRLAEMLTDDVDRSRLIILEAAAGYGKTCTSLEVVSRIIQTRPEKAPMLAELSKNRKAALFKYVLMDVIDRQFSHLKSDVVISEIKMGRVPLIIDGFDELLSKSRLHGIGDSPDDIEDAQTMLDTIAEYLQKGSRARVLLTTRGSSFASGDIFDSFAEGRLADCLPSRVQLLPPGITDWLSYDRVDALRASNIDIECLSSPVLLAMLRNEPVCDFGRKYTNIDDILNQYLDVLLEREMKRQSIPINKREQREIMEKLAAMMVCFDIASEDSDFIQEMLRDIITQDKMNDYLERYQRTTAEDIEQQRTEDELIAALSHHALLDRAVFHDNKVGFVNDFMFGVMISDAVINRNLSADEVSGKFLDYALSASSNRSDVHRNSLAAGLAELIDQLPAEQQLLVDICLMRRLTRNYKEEFWDGVNFLRNFVTDGTYVFTECVFLNCIFVGIEINPNSFSSCHFYNCRFCDINVTAKTEYDCGLIFTGCNGHEDFAAASEGTAIDNDFAVDYRKIVLEQYWPPGRQNATTRKAPRTLLRGVAHSNQRGVAKAIEKLKRDEILFEGIYTLELNTGKMVEIREILGRLSHG